MQLATRKILDRSFSALGLLSILFVAAALLVILLPIAVRGVGAFVFRGTVEHRRMMLQWFERGDRGRIESEVAAAQKARQPVYRMIAEFEAYLETADSAERSKYEAPLRELKRNLRSLLGPFPGESPPTSPHLQYGQTRWDRALVKLRDVLKVQKYDYSDPSRMGRPYFDERVKDFEGTSLEPLFAYIENHAEAVLRPRWTFYGRFLADKSIDSHFFGGIWPEMLGTFYLTIGAMLLAIPMGVIAAIYLAEYAAERAIVSFLRTCISTLAGVPSIVFGLFGLAFFINAIHVSPSKSVLAGSMTLAVLVLPIIIRASEEAILAVPRTYKEAALSLGAGKWHTVMTVILPAALPGILTGIVISMGRAAGETAPIIFTAAVSFGPALKLIETLSEGTPALSWNIYNLCTEHEAVDEIRHVQYGMVLTLVLLVLLLNIVAIALRARISKKLKG